ncbi:hypothetical protein C0431_05860 [bacterium]|nr:hypothetical protein [bacterium]
MEHDLISLREQYPEVFSDEVLYQIWLKQSGYPRWVSGAQNYLRFNETSHRFAVSTDLVSYCFISYLIFNSILLFSNIPIPFIFGIAFLLVFAVEHILPKSPPWGVVRICSSVSQAKSYLEVLNQNEPPQMSRVVLNTIPVLTEAMVQSLEFISHELMTTIESIRDRQDKLENSRKVIEKTLNDIKSELNSSDQEWNRHLSSQTAPLYSDRLKLKNQLASLEAQLKQLTEKHSLILEQLTRSQKRHKLVNKLGRFERKFRPSTSAERFDLDSLISSFKEAQKNLVDAQAISFAHEAARLEMEDHLKS